MSLFNIFNVAGSAMNAQSQRLNVVASNLANADSAVSANGEPYKAKQVVFAATPMGDGGATGVNVAAVIEDPSPMKLLYDPKKPARRREGLRQHAQRQCGGGDGQHDFRFAFLPVQCRHDEHHQIPVAQDLEHWQLIKEPP